MSGRRKYRAMACAALSERSFDEAKHDFLLSLIEVAAPEDLLKLPELHPSTRDFLVDWMSQEVQPESLKTAARYYSSLPPNIVAPNFTSIMEKIGCLEVPPYHHGRKAGMEAMEKPCSRNDCDWMSWWLCQGGFGNIFEKDVNGWTALMHALDSMTFSPYRAF